MIGKQIFHLYFGAAVDLTSVSTVLGVSQAINSMIIASTNWTSAANLFDAFVIDHFDIHMVPYAGSLAITYVAFDADNTTAIVPSIATCLNYPNVRMYNPTPSGTTTLASGDNGGYPLPVTFSHTIWPHSDGNDQEIQSGFTTGWCDTATPTYALGEMLFYNASTASTMVIYKTAWQFYARFRLIH